MWYVYLLESRAAEGERYIGVTSDLKRRIADQSAGKSGHTSKFLPWRIVTYRPSQARPRRLHSSGISNPVRGTHRQQAFVVNFSCDHENRRFSIEITQ